MPPKNKLKMQASKKASLMHAVLRARPRKKGSGSADNAAMLKESTQVITPLEERTNQSPLLERQGEDSVPEQHSVKDLTVTTQSEEPTNQSLLLEQGEDSVPDQHSVKDLTVTTQSEEQTKQSPLLEPRGEDLIADQDSVQDLTIEFPAQESTSFSIAGRRIIDVNYFYSRLQEISGHGNMSCGLQCVEIVAERQVGLHSKFTLKCKMCNDFFYIENDPPGEININDCAVVGSVAIGCGHSQLQELSAALNLPIMTPKTYRACHCRILTNWGKISVESMNAAAQKERDMAIAEGRVNENGIAIIDVIVDGCWCKRTYKKNYSALSGAATIIGKRTGEVLFLGVKNKYCSICAQAAKADKEAKDHECYKNYSGPSTAMESTILVEGFKCSIEMHNLIYGRMVSDGDSSTHAQLLKTRPYSNVSVEKIECRNHLLRNLCNKLTALQTDTKFILRHRKLITQKRIMILRQTIRKIIKRYKADSELERRCNIELLYNDLLLAHLHAFDDHSRCKPSFCNNTGEGESQHSEFYISTLWSRICVLMSNLASHAPSLIHDIDSNSVERYNSIVAKLVGGKRINFSKRGSYQTRCHAAVISFNTHKLISSTFKTMAGRSPQGSIKKLESRRIKQVMRIRKIIRKKNRKLFAKGEDINYGDKCDKPDMASHIFERQKKTFLQNLVKTKEDKKCKC